MEQPEFFEEDGKPRDNFVCKLRKGLYGLKQAGRVWYNHICQILINQGLRPCTGVDPCVFVNKAGDVIMALYVDYMGIWGEGEKKSKF